MLGRYPRNKWKWNSDGTNAYYFLISRGRYGLGTCYLRMSKIRLAEYHYRKAAEVHPSNAVLLGCLGMVRINMTGIITDKVNKVFRRLRGKETLKARLHYSTTRFGLLQITLWFAIGVRKSLSQ